ncbi:MAG TPA: hypothetical protein VHB54_10160 [Mucilaginibacter sp.]|nr:hypothetical protein [Mucilaginibacter sp.]
MKINRAIFIALILLSIPFCSVFAQNPSFNYVLTTNGDTIKCNFKKPFMGMLRYQPLGSDKFIKITTDKIKEYYNTKDSATVVATFLPDQAYPEFVNLLERGTINMYEKIVVTYNKYGTTTTYYWYVNKGFDALKELKATTIFTDGSRKERKKMFGDLIADNEPLKAQFEADNDFSLKRLQYYVHEYNRYKTGEVKGSR